MVKINDQELPIIAVGTWAWGDGAIGSSDVFGTSTPVEQLQEVFDASLKAGFNLFDTAAVYGAGASEQVLGQVMSKANRADVLVSTKFTPQMADGSATPVENMFAGSAERLGTDFADIYWIHNPSDVQQWTTKIIPLAKSGKIGALGVSNHNLDQLKQAQEILAAEGLKISAVQNHFSLLHRDALDNGYMDYCREQGIVFFAYMVLEQGALGGRYSSEDPFPADSQRGQNYNPIMAEIDRLVAALRKVAEAHDASVAQVATAWAIAQGTLPIVGVTKTQQVEDMAQIAAIKLTEQEVADIEAVAQSLNIDATRAWE